MPTFRFSILPVVAIGALVWTGLVLAQGRGSVVIGPSAPVPPEVAMLRPDAAELAQINDALQKFIASDQSAASAALKKYQSLLT